jgi:hypothetical protein
MWNTDMNPDLTLLHLLDSMSTESLPCLDNIALDSPSLQLVHPFSSLISLLTKQGLNSSPYVPTTPAFPDPRHHAVDGRYSSSSAGSGTGNGPYDHPGYPHGPPPHTMPDNGLVYGHGHGHGHGPDSYRENESWNVSPLFVLQNEFELMDQNGPPPFTQIPYGVYPDSQSQGQSQGHAQGQGQSQSSHTYTGTPTHHQTHEFTETPSAQHNYGETPGTTQTIDDF